MSIKKILIINGPNLNLLGKREPEIYGNLSFESALDQFKEDFSGLEITYYQSNIEGEIINEIQAADQNYFGIILNAGGYTHTSVAIADTIAAILTPCIEVHISQPAAREIERHISLIAKAVKGSISGFGMDSYYLALSHFNRL